MKFLLDTNIVSELRKSKADANVRMWIADISSDDLYLSVLVIGKIRLGVEQIRRRDPAQAAVYETWLVRLNEDFAERILPVTSHIAEEWGRMNVPDPVPAIDGLLAATAKVHGLTVATRNTTDFARTGVSLVNPFEPHSSDSPR